MEEMQNSYAGLISIHAAREGGDITYRMPQAPLYISIHAAREGGDEEVTFILPISVISIHAAREGGDALRVSFFCCLSLFQSTPPVKAATCVTTQLPPVKFISIHAAREGGDAALNQTALSPVISIHAAREGGDAVRMESVRLCRNFNPRRP